MPRHHRFGRADIRQKAREDIARNVEEANDQYRRYADMSLSNKGLMADRLVLEAQEGRRDIDKDVVSDEILLEKGNNLAASSLYAAAHLVYQLLLPAGVEANEKMIFQEHLTNEDFGNATDRDVKFRSKRMEILRREFARPDPLIITPEMEKSQIIAVPTPDKLNSLGGLLTLDQRVMAQLSVAASVVIQGILENVSSHEIPDPTNNYTTKRVIYVEDLIDYVHSNFSQNITIDPDTNDAFERLSKGSLSNFTRGLLRKFVTSAKTTTTTKDAAGNLNSVFFDETNDPDYGQQDGEAAYIVGTTPSMFKNIYLQRLQSMTTVAKDNVGKVWQSKAKHEDERVPYNAIWMSVASMIRGYSRTVFGTKFNMKKDDLIMKSGIVGDAYKDEKYDVVFDVVCSVLTLIAIHVMSYGLSYAIDAYIRLAIRGADRVDSKIIFTHDNVITPQIIFPGIKAALEMYGVSTTTWDKEMAFQLSTNSALMSLFLEAKKTYDIDNTKPGVKRFSNPLAEDPYWTQDRSSQNARNADWEEKKGRFNNQVTKSSESGGFGFIENKYRLDDLYTNDAATRVMDAKSVASSIANSISSLRRHSGQEQMLRERAGAGRGGIDIVGAAFGRSRRRGSKRRHSSKNKSHKASFGKKSRGSKKTRGSKKRRGSKKH